MNAQSVFQENHIDGHKIMVNKQRNYSEIFVNGKNVRLHRYLWEKYYGEIPEGYVIHHKNGNGLDNKIENFELLSDSEHKRKHLLQNKKFWERVRHDGRFRKDIKTKEIIKLRGNGILWHQMARLFKCSPETLRLRYLKEMN